MTDKDLFRQTLEFIQKCPQSIVGDRLINQLKMRVSDGETAQTDEERFIAHWQPTIGLEAAQKAWEEKQIAPRRQAAMVMGDIQPYISQIDGSVINSRSKHRTHLRDHGCIEVGNEVQKTTAKIPSYDPKLKQKIIDITNAKLGY
jgi:hypothetical protein